MFIFKDILYTIDVMESCLFEFFFLYAVPFNLSPHFKIFSIDYVYIQRYFMYNS